MFTSCLMVPPKPCVSKGFQNVGMLGHIIFIWNRMSKLPTYKIKGIKYRPQSLPCFTTSRSNNGMLWNVLWNVETLWPTNSETVLPPTLFHYFIPHLDQFSAKTLSCQNSHNDLHYHDNNGWKTFKQFHSHENNERNPQMFWTLC